MQFEKMGNRLVVTLDEIECDGKTDLEIVVREGGSERVAKAFLSAMATKRGPRFTLVTKQSDFRVEVERVALAHYDAPVNTR